MSTARITRVIGTMIALALVALLFFDLHRSQQDSRRSYTEAVRGLDLIGELQYHAQEARRTLLYALATTDSNLQVDYADQSRAAEADFALDLAEYRRLANEKDEIAIAEKISADWAAYLAVRDALIALMLEGDPKAAVARDLREGVPVFNAIRADLETTKQLLKANAGRLLAEVDASFRHSLLRMAGILGALAVLGAVSVKSARGRTAELAAARERFELAVLGSSDGLWDWDLRTNAVYFSPRWKEMLGYRDDEFASEFASWAEHLHPEDREPTERLLADYLAGRSGSYAAEFRMRCREGSYKWILARATALRGPDGQPTRMAGSHTDITERRRAEEALRAAEAKYRALVEQLPAITYHGRLGEICTWSYVSPQIETLLGFTPQEWLASDCLWRDQLHPDDLPGALAAEIVAERTGEYLAEYRMTTRAGELRWFRDQAVFAPGAEPGQDTLFGVMLDITERKLAEVHLAEINARLVDTSRMAGMAEVATGVLHNVGNVLNSVNVSAGLVLEKLRNSKAPKLGKAAELLTGRNGDLARYLTEDPNGQKLPAYLAKLGQYLVVENTQLLSEVDQLSRNIEHIKEIVAMQQSYAKVSGVFEDLAVDRLVEDSIAMNLGAFERHGVVLERAFSPAPPVRVDRHKVLQILINLIRNAKYALDDVQRTDKRMTISIVHADETTVRVSVRDNGIGISPENLARVFGHGFTTRKDGHGFGLHSGANAAKEMGGSLSVHSDGPGHGAAFTLELPIASTASEK